MPDTQGRRNVVDGHAVGARLSGEDNRHGSSSSSLDAE